MVSNGAFEQNVVLPDMFSYPMVGDNQFERACGWFRTSINNSPDYHYSNPLAYGIGVPCNSFGNEPDRFPSSPGDGYAGMFVTRVSNPPGWSSEIIATTLSSALLPNTIYRLQFDVSLADFFSQNSTRLQAFISTIGMGSSQITGALIPNSLLSTGILLESPTFSNTTNGWETITITFTTGPNISNGMQTLYIGALNNPQFQTETPASGGTVCFPSPSSATNQMYYYIDNISLIATGGASLNLPPSICSNQTLANLTTYLVATPTNGVFSGTGVVLNNNGIYSFNAGIAGVGVTTLSYTYNNNLGCPVTILGTITVTNTALVTPTFTFVSSLCQGGTAPVLPTTSSNGITGTWSPDTASNTVSADYIFTPSIGFCAKVVSKRVTVATYPTVTSITPATQTVCINSAPIVLQVIATGTGLSYQWYSNTTNSNSGGSLITGATAAAYVPSTTTTGTKYYYVRFFRH